MHRRTLTIDARKIMHSGIGRYLRNLLPGVIPRVNADRIVLIGEARELCAIAETDPRCTLWQSGARPHSLAEQMLALASNMQQTDVLWVPHYNLPLLYRGTLVTTLHDLAPLDLPEIFDHAAKRYLAGLLLQQSAARSAAILTPSQFSKDRITARLRAAPDRVHVTPLAVDPSWPELTGVPEQGTSAKPYLLFVGNLKPNKNLSTVVEAMELLGSAPALNLVVAGKTEGFRTGDNAAGQAARRLGERIRFAGEVSDAELIGLYRGAAMLVMPSLYEGFGLPVLEAMRYGCPVVTSRTTSLPEVAGDAAVLVDPRDPAALADAIRRVLHAGCAAQMREAGYLREREFRYDFAMERTAAVLNDVMDAAV